jgi:pantoate--beta-alanine ligase
MLLLKHTKDIDNQYKKWQKQRLKIGFVPTMGALHSGHISLIKASKKQADITVCSIFVNPTQFNDPTDFAKYPSTLSSDIELLEAAGCDVLFLPSVAEIYPNGTVIKREINFGFMADTLEGEHRPGHFQGMAQVVERLLRIVKPDLLFMGLKDYQQQMIVGELITKKKLATKLIACPTERERDGLAKSSRNIRLDEKSRKIAIKLSKALKQAKQKVKLKTKSIADVQALISAQLSAHQDISLEYFTIRNAKTLAIPKSKREKLVALVAAKIGGVRLIDNMFL